MLKLRGKKKPPCAADSRSFGEEISAFLTGRFFG
jgi:hypothetical protein